MQRQDIRDIVAEGRKCAYSGCGHAGTTGNERAMSARNAALKTAADYDRYPLSYAKRVLSRFTITSPIAQTLTGHGGFAQYLNRFKLKDSPYCACAPDKVQDVLHVLEECPIFGRERAETEAGTGVVVARHGFPALLDDETNRKTFLEFCERVTRRYRHVLVEILKNPEPEITETLKAFVEAIVNENVSLVISRQLLTDVGTHLSLLPDNVSQEVSHFALDVIQPRAISFEEQVSSIRQHLADIYERNQKWKEAAEVLVGIPLETGQKQYSVDYKLETYLKIARLYLEVDDPVQAEAYVNRASLLQAETTNEQLQIYYKVCYARVLDYRR
ncbi:COP9 signalosome complex subunit 4 [Eumeta japonica]|uniref:COP9 signalosome complex subunit 4 n=1 Tax=Eumeta variegata TaxID=151549 RepID=A0A4C1Y1Z0_EUMVA|nr:COP9 signalosome complex subunit 4 [Eumeta japonica]